MTQGFVAIGRTSSVGSHVWPLHCRAVLTATIQQTCKHFPAAGPSPADIHSARRGLKKSRALALLLRVEAAESDGAAIAVFERVRKSLAVARDLAVMGDMLGSLAPELDAPLVAKFASLLAAEKSGQVELAALDARNLCDDLQRQAALIEHWSLVRADAASIANEVRRTYKSALGRGLTAFERKDPEELHRLRKAVVTFRYQLDALAPAWPKLFHATAAEAQHLRTLLGEHHDLAALAAFAAAREERQGEHAAFAQLVAARQTSLVRKAQTSFARLFGERPKAFESRLLACLEHPKRKVKWTAPAHASRRIA
jgi:CHAD domain-containing protein